MSIKTSVLEDLGFKVIQNWLSNKCESIGGQQHALEFQSNLSLKETTQRLNFTEELLEAVIKNNVLPSLNIPEIKAKKIVMYTISTPLLLILLFFRLFNWWSLHFFHIYFYYI